MPTSLWCHRRKAGTEIGGHLLAAGRAPEALTALERARPKRSATRATRDDDLFPAEAEGRYDETVRRLNEFAAKARDG